MAGGLSILDFEQCHVACRAKWDDAKAHPLRFEASRIPRNESMTSFFDAYSPEGLADSRAASPRAMNSLRNLRCSICRRSESSTKRLSDSPSLNTLSASFRRSGVTRSGEMVADFTASSKCIAYAMHCAPAFRYLQRPKGRLLSDTCSFEPFTRKRRQSSPRAGGQGHSRAHSAPIFVIDAQLNLASGVEGGAIQPGLALVARRGEPRIDRSALGKDQIVGPYQHRQALARGRRRSHRNLAQGRLRLRPAAADYRTEKAGLAQKPRHKRVGRRGETDFGGIELLQRTAAQHAHPIAEGQRLFLIVGDPQGGYAGGFQGIADVPAQLVL